MQKKFIKFVNITCEKRAKELYHKPIISHVDVSFLAKIAKASGAVFDSIRFYGG